MASKKTTTKYKVVDIRGKVWQKYDTKEEADTYVLKLGDKSILAKVVEA
jgi:hypothetical protein